MPPDPSTGDDGAEAPVFTSESGITILEVLVVLVILSLIAVVGTIQVSQMMDRAKVDVAKLQLQQIANAVEIYRIDTGHYPTADEGLGVLLIAGDDETNWRGPYLKGRELLVDPWNEPVRYSASEGRFTLVSLGTDRKEGGEGAASDILVKGAG